MCCIMTFSQPFIFYVFSKSYPLQWQQIYSDSSDSLSRCSSEVKGHPQQGFMEQASESGEERDKASWRAANLCNQGGLSFCTYGSTNQQKLRTSELSTPRCHCLHCVVPGIPCWEGLQSPTISLSKTNEALEFTPEEVSH